MMLEAHNLAPFSQEKALPKLPVSPRTLRANLLVSAETASLLSICSLRNKKEPKESRVFTPKIILNLQYRMLEKNLKANIKTDCFFFFFWVSMVTSPLPSTKKQPNHQMIIFLGPISLFLWYLIGNRLLFPGFREQDLQGYKSCQLQNLNLSKISFTYVPTWNIQ